MKSYEQRPHTGTYKAFVSRACDLCGLVSKSDRNWKDDEYHIDETEVKLTVGIKEWDGRSDTEYTVDICPDCFKGKLIPWLQSQGATIQEKNYDW